MKQNPFHQIVHIKKAKRKRILQENTMSRESKEGAAYPVWWTDGEMLVHEAPGGCFLQVFHKVGYLFPFHSISLWNEFFIEKKTIFYHRILYRRCSMGWMHEMNEVCNCILTWPQRIERRLAINTWALQVNIVYGKRGYVEKVLDEIIHWFDFVFCSLTLISGFLLL